MLEVPDFLIEQRRISGAYQQQTLSTDGWLVSAALPIMLQHGSNSLAIQLTNIESKLYELGIVPLCARKSAGILSTTTTALTQLYT